MLQKLEFERHILTKGPENTISAWTEKVDWCRRHVPDALITITQDKSLVYGRVLMDDWPGYIVPWLNNRPRGTVVMVAQPWNADFSHPQVVRYDGRNPKEVYNRLELAKMRMPA